MDDPGAVAGKQLFQQVGLVVPGFSCQTCHGGPKLTRSIVDYTTPPSPDIGLGLGNEQVIGAELRRTNTQPNTPGPIAAPQFPGVLLNVGTFTLGGGRTNEIRSNLADIGTAATPLGANGFNIPSLFSVFETAPYFYSGLAQTLEDVLNGSQDGNGGVRHHFVANAQQRADLIRFLNSIDPVRSPEDVIAELIDKVLGLVSAGILNHGEGNSLLAKLEAAQASISRGNTTAALNQLGAFTNEVKALINSGRISLDQGQMLIDLARIAQAGLAPTFKGSKTKMKAEVSSVKTDTDAGGQDTNVVLTSAGERTTGTGRFTLNIPDDPGLTSPVDGAVVSNSGMVVKWNHVSNTSTGAPLNRTGYEIIISKAVPDDAQRSSRPTFNVHVRPSVTSLTVPGKFLEPKTQYELKLLALEVSGRQIVSVIHFTTQ